MSRTKKDRKRNFSLLSGIPSWFKKMQQRARRAKERAAVRDGKEPPRTRRTDHWDYW